MPPRPIDLTQIQRRLHQHPGAIASSTSTTPDSVKKHTTFVAIDIEAYEHAHDLVLEVGIATLQTKDLVQLESPFDAAELESKIHARHLITQEHSHLQNKDYVHGNPLAFDFGTSEILSLADVRDVTRGVLSPSPAQPSADTEKDSVDGAPTANDEVILIAHDLRAEKRLLARLGVDVTRLDLYGMADTQILCGGTKKNRPGLGRLVKLLGLEARNMHNAGNDAALTLKVMLRLATLDGGQGNKAALEELRRSLPGKKKG